MPNRPQAFPRKHVATEKREKSAKSDAREGPYRGTWRAIALRRDNRNCYRARCFLEGRQTLAKQLFPRNREGEGKNDAAASTYVYTCVHGFALHEPYTRNRMCLLFAEIQGVSLKANRIIAGRNKILSFWPNTWAFFFDLLKRLARRRSDARIPAAFPYLQQKQRALVTRRFENVHGANLFVENIGRCAWISVSIVDRWAAKLVDNFAGKAGIRSCGGKG